MSSEFSAFLRSHGIAHTHSAVYNPMENGLVEVFNRVLKFGVQCFCHDGVSWEEGIQELLKTYCATPTRPGSKSPTAMFFGQTFWLDSEQTQGAELVLRTMASIKPGASPLSWARLLSDGQKWNSRLLKCFVPPVTTWPEIL